MEVWKPLCKFEGLYSISSTGRIRREPRIEIRDNGRPYPVSFKQLTPHPDTKGYLFVRIRKDRRRHNVWMHRAVFEAFVRPLKPNEQVDHIDSSKTNNCVSNLQGIDPRDHGKLSNDRYAKRLYDQGYRDGYEAGLKNGKTSSR